VIDIPLGRLEDLVRELGPDFEVDVNMLRDAILHGRFFGHAHGPYDEAEFSRSRSIPVRSGKSLTVKSPEDTILRKLLWFREGGEVSDRQWRDVLGVIRAQGEALEMPYLIEWARRLFLAQLLERALAHAQQV
jgi:hypothetical protein